MESTVLSDVFLPICLAIIMLGMGLSLKTDDFKRILVYPKAVSIGLINQLVLLPLVAYLIIKLFGLTTELAVGIMIIAACPGGATSNLISHLAKGDTALSITLTAISSLITVFTIPFIVNFAIIEFMPDGQKQPLNVFNTVIAVIVITLIPVIIGMIIHKKAPGFSAKMAKPVKIVSAIFLVLIIAGVIFKEKDEIGGFFVQAGSVALALNLSMLVIGFFSSKLLKLNLRQVGTISVETGIQNGTLGIAIAATLIGNSQMSIPPAIYSLIMFGTAFVIIVIGNRVIKD